MPDSPETFWFMDGHVAVLLSRQDNQAGLSITEHLLPCGFSPPFHVHRDEDEIFYLVEGAVRFRLGDETRDARQGEVVHLPRGIPHGFRIVSTNGARCLVISNGGFEAMIRAGSRPAEAATLPEPQDPTPEMQVRLAAVCAANGIDLLGPPIG